LRQIWYVIEHVRMANRIDVIVSVVVLAVIFGFTRFAPRFPGALLAVVGAIAASAMLHWSSGGVKVVGAVPSGLPRIGWPEVGWADVMPLMAMSFSCCIVILAQSAATSRAYAMKYNDAFSENNDLVGLSFANIAAGLSGSFVVNGSPTKTEIVDMAGGRSQIAQLVTCATVVVVLLFLTGPLSYLPEAVLAAIVFMIGLKLIDVKGMRDILSKEPGEFFVALVTAATVEFVGVEAGVLLALVMSVLQHVRRSYQPHSAVILNDPREHWRMESVKQGKGEMIEHGIVVYWFGADLFYANVGHFVREVHEVALDSPGVRWLIVDAGAMTDIDYTAGEALRGLYEELTKRGVGVAVTRVSTAFKKDLDDLGITAMIGERWIFASRRDCIAACRQASI